MGNTQRTGVIYSCTNLTNGKKYIGRTFNFKHRVHIHKMRIKQGKDTHGFYEEYREHPEYFKFEIISENIPESSLPDMEKYYIKYYNTCGEGYNKTIGGESNYPTHYSEERNKKISETMKKNPPTKGKHRVYDENGKYHYE